MAESDTREIILSIARDIVASNGLHAVSFDAIAQKLGRSKQAVLYWFPNKPALLAAMFVPWLAAEAGAATASLETATNRDEAIRSFVIAVAGFHFADLERFRMMYLLPQTARTSATKRQAGPVLDHVHPVTDSLYAALAAHLPGDRDEARREALAIHASVLGLVLVFALGDAIRDPLKHGAADMVETLCRALTGRTADRP